MTGTINASEDRQEASWGGQEEGSPPGPPPLTTTTTSAEGETSGKIGPAAVSTAGTNLGGSSSGDSSSSGVDSGDGGGGGDGDNVVINPLASASGSPPPVAAAAAEAPPSPPVPPPSETSLVPAAPPASSHGARDSSSSIETPTPPPPYAQQQQQQQQPPFQSAAVPVEAPTVVVVAYPVQDVVNDDGVAVAYAVGRGYYPEPAAFEQGGLFYLNVPTIPALRIEPDGRAVMMYDDDDVSALPGRWNDSIFGCFRQFKPTCLMATCCSCIVLSQLAERVRWGIGYRPLMLTWTFLYLVIWICNYKFADVTTYPILLWIGLTWSLTWHLRWFIRVRYNIAGHCLCDMVKSVLCNCCVIAQMARHVFYYRSCCEEGCECGPPLPLP